MEKGLIVHDEDISIGVDLAGDNQQCISYMIRDARSKKYYRYVINANGEEISKTEVLNIYKKGE